MCAREILVLSGKGGTGKTTLVGSFAALVVQPVLVDCDVDAADLHMLLSPTVQERREFWSGQQAWIDPEACTQCGLCRDLCRFHAIEGYRVVPEACEGCGLCARVCPVEAIQMRPVLAGHWMVSSTPYGRLVDARLRPGQGNSGRLVAEVRRQAQRLARDQRANIIISDGLPGIGCPAIAALAGVDVALVVTEPTLSGIHDLERVVSLTNHFGVRTCVAVNKWDISEENTRRIEVLCEEVGTPVLARLSYDPNAFEALRQGMPLVECSSGPLARGIKELWEKLLTVPASVPARVSIPMGCG